MLAYKNTKEHINNELLFVDLLLGREMLRTGIIDQNNIKDNSFIKKLQNKLALTLQEKDIAGIPDIEYILFNKSQFSELYTQLAKANQNRTTASLKAGVELKLEKLCTLFNLNGIEKLILCVCLAPKIDYIYGKLFAYMHDDPAEKHPCTPMILNIVNEIFPEETDLMQYFSQQATLFSYGLLEYKENTGSDTNEPLIASNRVMHYLLGDNRLDDTLAGFATLHAPDKMRNQEISKHNSIWKSVKSAIKKNKETLANQTSNILFILEGARGSGKQQTAKRTCAELDMSLLIIDMEAMLVSGYAPEELQLCLKRESVLNNTALYFKNIEYVINSDVELSAIKKSISQFINNTRSLVFAGTTETIHYSGTFAEKRKFHFTFPLSSFEERMRVWHECIDSTYTLADKVDIEEIANKFQLTSGQIRTAVSHAFDLSQTRPGNAAITLEDLTTACRAQSNHKLTELATKIEPNYDWDDIILAENSVQQLREIVSRANHKHVVYGNWEHGTKHSLGKGLTALFAGPSGTGKTMAAEIIAGELQLDLYKIDLSTIVSKYIGETEKNLSKIFKEAETSNAILFFDEADALFGSRSEVKDSHDRYANIEVGYLLQKMDEYQGIAILASNLKDNMDKAFLRRIQFLIHFTDPDEQQRGAIWQKVFTEKTPLSPDIDFDFLARQFKLTGGNIKNIGLGAAFIAASNGKLVTMEHIIHATGREWNKIGRACTKQEFADYYELVK